MLPEQVVAVADLGPAALREILNRYGLEVVLLPTAASIPGSYWGESEAGLIGSTLYARPDTPVHSVLHEAAHFVCMDTRRRVALNRDAGGDDAEENGVCYLQILWASELDGFGRTRMFQDMDAWGYSFRFGSAQRWFEEDAADAREWLVDHDIIDATGAITWRCRKEQEME